MTKLTRNFDVRFFVVKNDRGTVMLDKEG